MHLPIYLPFYHFVIDLILRILDITSFLFQFGGQEPGTRDDIFKFTKDKGVRFDLFEKVEVNGDNTHPLWQFLKTAQGGTIGDFIKWNFSKFIVDRNGIPVERFGPNVNPLDMEQTLVKYL